MHSHGKPGGVHTERMERPWWPDACTHTSRLHEGVLIQKTDTVEQGTGRPMDQTRGRSSPGSVPVSGGLESESCPDMCTTRLEANLRLGSFYRIARPCVEHSCFLHCLAITSCTVDSRLNRRRGELQRSSRHLYSRSTCVDPSCIKKK